MRIRQAVLQGIIADAMERSPNEACGYLAGADGVIETHFPLTNVDASAEHYSLDPKEQFACVKTIRARQMALRAVYHSHPATPARPSQEDIRLSRDPALSYVIVSLAGAAANVKSFLIRNGNVEEEKLEVI